MPQCIDVTYLSVQVYGQYAVAGLHALPKVPRFSFSSPSAAYQCFKVQVIPARTLSGMSQLGSSEATLISVLPCNLIFCLERPTMARTVCSMCSSFCLWVRILVFIPAQACRCQDHPQLPNSILSGVSFHLFHTLQHAV